MILSLEGLKDSFATLWRVFLKAEMGQLRFCVPQIKVVKESNFFSFLIVHFFKIK